MPLKRTLGCGYDNGEENIKNTLEIMSPDGLRTKHMIRLIQHTFRHLLRRPSRQRLATFSCEREGGWDGAVVIIAQCPCALV